MKILSRLMSVAKTFSSMEFKFSEGGRYEKNRFVKPMFLNRIQDGKVVAIKKITDYISDTNGWHGFMTNRPQQHLVMKQCAQDVQ